MFEIKKPEEVGNINSIEHLLNNYCIKNGNPDSVIAFGYPGYEIVNNYPDTVSANAIFRFNKYGY